ncbi:Putative glycoside hydrolase family 71 [Septoria linicola]|uniref:Glycoside hydrolase family 71 n=1 Tax=Septoria linicola TaxID=215465 RepID=A0A9Q9B1U3_9PEZI|nr:putative glycoside hydrolase family 71 [Septoria linicola]USW54806.1 Putative glycoside hydrolase family 71 [Septoria linicola]
MNWLSLAVTALMASAVEGKAVLAHFMLANSYSYSLADWQFDIKAAQDARIDAFALNMAYNPSSQLDQSIANAFQAANSAGFKLIFSFDYAGNGAWPQSQVVNYMKQYGSNGAYMQYNGKPVASTFEGVNNAGDWSSIKSQTNCFFVPDWASAGPTNAASAAGGVADGLFAWEAWPNGPNNMGTLGDSAYIKALGSEPYMMAVSPWFYANVPTWNKNWLWRGDDLWYDRWSQVLQLQPQFVQIISWNDWPESHYIGPQRAADFGAFAPGGAPYNYAENMPHDGWRALLPYWIDLYKNGAGRVSNETLSYWYRLSPKDSCSDGGTTGNDAGHNQQTYRAADVVQDRVFFTALLGSAADAIVTIGGTNTTATWSKTPSGGSGLYHGSVPFNGKTGAVSIRIARGAMTVVQQTGQPISTTCRNGVTNWNAWVGSVVGNAPGSASTSSTTSTSRAATSSSTTRSTTTIPASSSSLSSSSTRASTSTSSSLVSSSSSSSPTSTQISSSSTTASSAPVTSTLTMAFTMTQNVVCVCSPDCACSPVGAPATVMPNAAAVSTSSTVTR